MRDIQGIGEDPLTKRPPRAVFDIRPDDICAVCWPPTPAGDAPEFFVSWLVLPWDEEAASRFAALRLQRIRIGTMDLKIASIVLAHDATLLTRPFDCAQGTRNTADFAQVPGLKFENWLD